jgi:hypothetical protein
MEVAGLTPGERATGTQWICGRVGPRARLDTAEKRKKPLPLYEIKPQPVAYRYTDWAIVGSYSENFLFCFEAWKC